MAFWALSVPTCLGSLISLTSAAGRQCWEGDSSQWGTVSGYHRSPVEDEGDGKGTGSCPTESEAKSQARICRGRSWGGSCPPTEARHGHSPLPTPAQSPTPRWSIHPVLGTWEAESKEEGPRHSGKSCRGRIGRREGRREEGRRRGKAPGEASAEESELGKGSSERTGGQSSHGSEGGGGGGGEGTNAQAGRGWEVGKALGAAPRVPCSPLTWGGVGSPPKAG